MAIIKERLEELEKFIGLLPVAYNESAVLLRIVDNSLNKSIICKWLTLRGLPESHVRSAKDASLAKAYCIPSYLVSWRNRVNPGFGLLDGPEDEDDAFYDAALDRAREMANTLPKPEPPASQAMTKAETELWLKDLFKQVEKTVADLTNEKLAKATIKLDDGAKFQIRDLAKAQAKAIIEELIPPRQIEIVDAAQHKVVPLGLQHEKFPLLLRAVQARDHRGFRLNIWLTGATGSGKTTAAESICKALEHTFSNYSKAEDGTWTIANADGSPADLNGLSHSSPFGADSSLDADYKVIGFKDANGKFHWTTFLRVFVFGGIYVADEIDNWMPSALVAMNAALANGWISTPIGLLNRHPDTCIIACANTWGLGATNDYVGRTRLDAASLDRFHPKINWPIDERLERAVAEQMGGELGLDWHDVVLKARSAATKQGLKIIVSPRATFTGIALLKQGFTDVEVIEMTIAAGLSPEQAKAIGVDPASNRPFADRREVA